MRRILTLALTWAVALFSVCFSTENGRIQWMSDAEASGHFNEGQGDPCDTGKT